MSGIVVLMLRLLLVIALYAFLTVALWVMWKQLEHAGARGAREDFTRISLEVRTSGQRPERRSFTQSEITLGRDPRSDLPLAEEAVSLQHALISFHDGHWWVRDLGSRNGTRLNSEPLSGPTVLAHGDEIRCGHVSVGVGLDADSSAHHGLHTGTHNG